MFAFRVNPGLLLLLLLQLLHFSGPIIETAIFMLLIFIVSHLLALDCWLHGLLAKDFLLHQLLAGFFQSAAYPFLALFACFRGNVFFGVLMWTTATSKLDRIGKGKVSLENDGLVRYVKHGRVTVCSSSSCGFA